VRDKVVAQLEESANILAQSTQQRRSMLSKSYQRFATTTPPLSMPTLKCPLCGRPLNYEQSQVGGVSERHSEQWDEFTCSECGTFEYRHRTRKLRHVSEPFPL
jgi:hypothetical protein